MAALWYSSNVIKSFWLYLLDYQMQCSASSLDVALPGNDVSVFSYQVMVGGSYTLQSYIKYPTEYSVHCVSSREWGIPCIASPSPSHSWLEQRHLALLQCKEKLMISEDPDYQQSPIKDWHIVHSFSVLFSLHIWFRGHMKVLGMSSTSDTHLCGENIQKSSTLDNFDCTMCSC